MPAPTNPTFPRLTIIFASFAAIHVQAQETYPSVSPTATYTDSEGNLHQVSQDWGDERYTIEFKENGIVEGRIGENTFSGYYMLPYTPKIEPNEENNYRDDLTYGVINLWGWNVTEANDDDPLSKQFMRIFNATQFKLWSSDLLVLRLSEREVFGFMRENIKQNYGYK